MSVGCSERKLTQVVATAWESHGPVTIQRGVVAWQEARWRSGGLLTGWKGEMIDVRAARVGIKEGKVSGQAT
jgi:hypothetical protein